MGHNVFCVNYDFDDFECDFRAPS